MEYWGRGINQDKSNIIKKLCESLWWSKWLQCINIFAFSCSCSWLWIYKQNKLFIVSILNEFTYLDNLLYKSLKIVMFFVSINIASDSYCFITKFKSQLKVFSWILWKYFFLQSLPLIRLFHLFTDLDSAANVGEAPLVAGETRAGAGHHELGNQREEPQHCAPPTMLSCLVS